MKRYIIYFSLFVLSSILYFIDLSASSYISHVHNFFKRIIHPIFELKGKISEKTREAIDTYLLLKNVSLENQRLRRELQECEIYKVQSATYQRALLDLAKAVDLPLEIKNYPLVYANAIAYDPSGQDSFVLINRGSGSGISEGMIVFYRGILLGVVEEVYGSSSRVKTIFSKDFSISVSSRNKAYIYKGGFPYGSLLYVKLEDEIEEGDLVFLRSQTKNLPEFLIGTVKRVSHEGGGFFKKVEVKPLIDVRKISIYTILKEKL